MHEAFQITAHRPYPLNPRPWIVQQEWRDLAFLHWRVPHDLLRPFVPASLELETFDGSAWLGVVPFHEFMSPRGMPIQTVHFHELNVRTYVQYRGKSGVYFFRLCADSFWIIVGGRLFFRLPYRHLNGGTFEDEDGWFRSTNHPARGSCFDCKYRPLGDTFMAEPGSLEHFLTERYCFLLEHKQQQAVLCCDIQHNPWQLQRAEVKMRDNDFGHSIGLDLSEQQPHALFAKRTVMVNWMLERID